MYESLGIAAKALGISREILRYRLLSYYYPDYTSKYHSKEDFGEIVRIRVGGMEYDSIEYAAKKLQISLEWLRARLASFDYPDYVCADMPQGQLMPKYIVRDKPYTALNQIAEAEGTTVGEIRRKMSSTLYPDYVCSSIPKKPPTLPLYKAHRKVYKTIREVAEAEGLPVEEISDRFSDPLNSEYRRLWKRQW